MSDFGRMREYAGAQADYIEELETIIDGLPTTTKNKFPMRPDILLDVPWTVPEPPQPPPAAPPPVEPPPAEPAP